MEVAWSHLYHSPQTQIAGKVILEGIPPPEIPIRLDPLSARLHPTGLTTRHYRLTRDGGLANVFVYIKEGLNGRTFAPAGKDATIEFRGGQFEPYVIGVRTNQDSFLCHMGQKTVSIHSNTPLLRGQDV